MPAPPTPDQSYEAFSQAAANYGLISTLRFVTPAVLDHGALPTPFYPPPSYGGNDPWRDLKAGMKLGRAVAATLRTQFSKVSSAAEVYGHYQNVRNLLARLARNRARKGLPPAVPTNDEFAEAVASDLMDRLARPPGGFVVLSANPLDVLLMSSCAAYSSCHDLLRSDSAHRAGPLQYACDGHTAVAYFYRAEKVRVGLGALPHKIWRQLVHFDLGGGACTFVRQYPQKSAAPPGLAAQLDRMAAQVLARHKGCDPVFSTAPVAVEPCVKAGPTLAYLDGAAAHGGHVVRLLGSSGPRPLPLAAAVPCPSCGRGILCRAKDVRCELCDGFVCALCKKPKARGERRFGPRKSSVCAACYDQNYFVCDRCFKVKDKGRARSVLSGGRTDHYCAPCARQYTTPCAGCKKSCLKDSACRMGDGKQFCQPCFAKKFAVCLGCAQATARSEARRWPASGSRCQACYDRLKAHLAEEMKSLEAATRGAPAAVTTTSTGCTITYTIP